MSEAVTLALHGTRTHTCAQAFAGCVGASLGRFRTVTYIVITLVMSSSITTTLIMAVGPTVGAAVAYSKLVLVRMNVPGAVLFGTSQTWARGRRLGYTLYLYIIELRR